MKIKVKCVARDRPESFQNQVDKALGEIDPALLIDVSYTMYKKRLFSIRLRP